MSGEDTLVSGFTLGELLPLRIHQYITNLLIHRRNQNDRGRYDVLDQWMMDVTSYLTTEEAKEAEEKLYLIRKSLENAYKTRGVDKELRIVEKILHRASDRAQLKAANLEAQQIVDYEAQLQDYKEAKGL